MAQCIMNHSSEPVPFTMELGGQLKDIVSNLGACRSSQAQYAVLPKNESLRIMLKSTERGESVMAAGLEQVGEINLHEGTEQIEDVKTQQCSEERK